MKTNKQNQKKRLAKLHIDIFNMQTEKESLKKENTVKNKIRDIKLMSSISRRKTKVKELSKY